MSNYALYYNRNKKELKNTALINDLDTAKETYQRGDIPEAREILYDIVASLDAYIKDHKS